MRKVLQSTMAMAFIAGLAFAGQTASAQDYDVVGNYDLTLVNAVTEANVGTASVEVRKSGENYLIVETDNSNYFLGMNIPFTYNPAGYAIFDAAYVKELVESDYALNPYLWFSGQVDLEPQATMAVVFTGSNGFNFTEGQGWALYACDSEEEFNPVDIYLAYTVTGCTVSSATTIYGDESIEGDWNFTLNWNYTGDTNLGEKSETFTAMLEGNVVTFTSADEEVSFMAIFTSATELTFTESLVSGASLVNSTWQYPFINTAGTADMEELTTASFKATYDAEAGTISFPANSGLRFGYVNNSTREATMNKDAFDFVSAVKAGQASTGFANPLIVGNWTFNLNGKYLGDASLGDFTDNYVASLEGNTVTFLASDEKYNIIAEFTAENTLTFNKAFVGDPEAVNGLWMYPFVNSNNVSDIDDLNDQSFTATFDPLYGTLTFTANAGLKYGFFNNTTNELVYWEEAFDVVSASKSAPEEVIYANPAIEGQWYITVDNVYQPDETVEGYTQVYTATLDANAVTFAAADGKYNLIGVFTAENTITFSPAKVLEAEVNSLWQYPFVNETDETDIEELPTVTFEARFYPSEGVLIFPEKSGMRYAYLNNETQTIVFWDDAFDFVSASQISPEETTPSLSGSWNVTMDGHYLGSDSKGKFTEEMAVAEDGNTATFTSSGSPYNMVAEVSGNVLTFAPAAVGEPATYTLWQYPYINTTGTDNIEELTTENFSATYNAEEGTIEFPANAGLRYGYFDADGNLSYWADAFDLISAVKLSVDEPIRGEITGTMTAQPAADVATGDSDLQEPLTWEVTATYNSAANSITIYNFAGLNKVTFYISDTGAVSSESDVVSSTQDGVNYYYGDITNEELIMYGIMMNIDENESQLTVEPWGQATETEGEVNFVSAFYNTTIILNVEIPTLTSKVNSIGNSVEGEAVYYDLQGRQVKNPTKGLYILKQGDKVSKVMINK